MTTPARINELNQAELPAVELLRKLGYTFVPREVLAAERNGEREVLLKARLKAALLRLNEWLTQDQAERVIFNLERVDAVGMARNQAVHEYLTYGMPIEADGPGGRRTRTVRFFDFDHPQPGKGLNEFLVTSQMRVRRGNERDRGEEDDELLVKPDIILFVNGIPLVVMEAKSPTLLDVWRHNAIRQLHRYQELGPQWQGAGAPELFAYNLLCVAHCGAAAVYGSVGAPENAYAEWKSVLPFDKEEVRRRFGEEPRGQAQLIVGLLAPATLLEILRDFVVFESEKGRLVKKLPRYQQYRAVKKAMQRILKGRKPEERGGVVWHTQGSGKSLTMLWLAVKLRREPSLRNPTILVVTDRTQLDEQITKTFVRCGFPAPERAERSRPEPKELAERRRARNPKERDPVDLQSLLRSASGRTIMTTVQKFEEALTTPEGELDVLNADENLFVMVDEAHRTQYGLLGARMEKALPNATFLGFTGTPIDKGFRRSTMRRFGPLVDAYTIRCSVTDGATVPIYYEARLPDLAIQGPNTLDKLFDALFGDEPDDVRERIRRRYANKETVAEAARRIEMIALDIAEHFKKHVRPNGFKAQVVAPSRAAAVRYAEHLRDFGISAYPIITTSPDDGPEFKWARELPQAQIISAFVDPAGEPEVLVVVDMLLTGFDAPVEQVLYLDRALREHGLLQAIARVNRRFSHERDGVTTEKTYGLVVDYHGVSRELEEALEVFEKRDTREAMLALPEDPAAVIDAAAARAESHFKGLDLDDAWACVMRFAPDASTEGDYKADLFELFSADYHAFARLMDQFLPDPRALPYVPRLARLAQVRSMVRSHFQRVDASIDWTDVGAKVKKLLDERIDAEVRELMKPVSILDRDFEEKIASLPHEEARASVMEHALRAQIKERLADNPAFYERLSQQLERIIQELRQRVIDAAEACRRMAELRRQVRSETDIASEHGLTAVSFAIYELLEKARSGEQALGDASADAGHARISEENAPYRTRLDEALKQTATRIEAVLAPYRSIVDWQTNFEVQRQMRRDIKRELRGQNALSEDELDELAREVVEVAKRRLM
ncbi:MAG TPA: type I restriction endonuclease subunit R [Dehalococcoidia bacterium]|nr:type I restriction endonuclease subunit R [Dehalococcoidia bacterium]